MTFSRIKAQGWALNEVVTSVQLNQLDIDHSNSIDKTGDNATNGGGISGRVDVLGTGQIDLNSGSELNLKTGGQIIQNGGAYQNLSGVMNFFGTSQINFNDSAQFTLQGTGDIIVGSLASILSSGTINATSGGTIGINSNATLHIKSGGDGYVDNGGDLYISGGGDLIVQSTGEINMESGSNLNITNATTIISDGVVSITGGATVALANGSASFLTVGTGNTFTGAGTNNLSGAVNVGNHPVFIGTRSRVLIDSCANANINSGSWSFNGVSAVDFGTGGIINVPLNRTHHGATLNQLFISFTVGLSHASQPASRPTFFLARNRWDTPLNSSAESLVSAGTLTFPSLGSGAAWYNGGAPHFMQITCNQNNVIDNEQYYYFLFITNESGAGSQNFNEYGTIYLDYSGIPSTKWSM